MTKVQFYLEIHIYLCVVKFLLNIGLILVILSPSVFKTVLVLDWKINQDLITEKYCVNKDNPMLNCNGQCYLSKQLKKLDAEEQSERQKHQLPENKLKEIEFNYLAEKFPLSWMEEVTYTAVQTIDLPTYLNLYQFHFSQKNNPPPDFC